MRTHFKVLIFFIVSAGLFYWKILFQHKVIFPGDLLIGAYFPWLDFKWGYAVGVPIKNPLISDIFSQFFIWKSLIAESFSHGQWPLWNPYSYSGYPLLANFNSGALNPFNLLLIFFGDISGWNYLVATQTLGSLFAFYLFTKETGISTKGSIIAAITYAFSGFAITWLPFVNVGYSFVWLALIFLCIEKYFNTKKSKYLYPITPLLFLFITAGHFQAVVFGCILFGSYFIYRYLRQKKKQQRSLYVFILSVGLGLLLSAVQLLPTLELMPLSVRFVEGYIADFGYGLLPLTHVLTLFAPDFFGNASTNNYWSVFNYHETVIYLGVFPLLSVIGALFEFKKLDKYKFFLFSFIVSLLFIFNTYLGRAIYEYDIPLISTSAAGRISFLIVLSASVLAGWWYDHIKHLSFKKVLRYYWFFPLIYIILFSLSFVIYKMYLPYIDVIPVEVEKAKIAWRNIVYPFTISMLLIATIVLLRKTKVLFYVLCAVILMDVFRFGWKYLPFVDNAFVYPSTPIIEFLQRDTDIFRVEKEKAQLFPPNTWAAYRLSSTSGYDPMATEEYASFYNIFLNNTSQGFASRYSELGSYDSGRLGKVNIKYLLALKRGEKDVIDSSGESIYYKINTDEWTEVFEDGSVVVLKNNEYAQRSYLIDDIQGIVDIVDYSPNKVIINYTATKTSELALLDTYYPGWKAYVNGIEEPIRRHMGVFRKITVSKGEGTVIFEYAPTSFYLGLKISLLTLLAWIMLYRSQK